MLQSASSGGASILSSIILRNSGTVFGACYSQNFKSAEFACIERLEDLHLLKGSKYILTEKRVFINGEYKSLWPLVAEKLASGKEVLFTGLGCDVAALYSYLKANHIDSSKLFTADLICYGPALPEIHRQYIASLEKKYHSRIKSFTVRYKAEGWTPPFIRAEFENGKIFQTPFYGTDYGKAFGLYSREACYSCSFKGTNHQADITLGDYWGLTPQMPGWNDNGVSVFIVRSAKGEELMSRIDSKEFTVGPADLDFVIEHNPMYYTCKKKPNDYAKFCADLESVGLHKAMFNHIGYVGYCKMLLKKCAKKIIPVSALRMLKKFLRRK